VTPDEWEVIQSIEPEEVESFYGISNREYLEGAE